MKIGIFDPYLDDCGGGEKYMMSIAELLSHEHEVDVFWDDKEDIKGLLDRFSIDLSKVNFIRNIFSPKINLFRRLLATKKYDILIILSDGSIPLSLAKKTFLHLQQPIPISNISRKTRFKIKRVNGFFCNSYYSKSYIDDVLKVDSLVLYPPVEIKAKKIKKENIILNVGRFRIRDNLTGISNYKKQDVMIDIFKKMVEDGFKNWEFILAVSVRPQDSEKFEILKKTAKGFPITFVVNNSNDELWDLYSRAKIYWHASGFGEDLKRFPQYAEHFGISTVEAMGAGAVPVVINAGGQTEIVENEKSGFLWNSGEELIEKTKILIKNEKLREKMSGEAVKRAYYFGFDEFKQRLKKVIGV